MRPPIYLDYQATTPVDPRVLEAMLPYFGANFGNAASRSHSFGWTAEKAVERARKRVAHLAGAHEREIIFTSGATESNNLAIKGTIEARGTERNHIVTCATEHKAVLDPIRRLQDKGCRVTVLPVCSDGLLDLAHLRAALTAETLLVSVMWANNETAVVQPIREIGAICRERRVLFHCDAAQAFGKLPVDVEADGIDLLSLSAHKMYGPKGIGALYVRRRSPRVELAAQIDGGGHESGLRSGTLNVPGIVGFGEACALCGQEMGEGTRLIALRHRLLKSLTASLEGVTVNGSLEHRLPGNLNLTLPGVDAGSLLLAIPEIALSTGSACSSANPEPSHVLRAMGLSTDLAHSSLRIGLGRFTTEEEVDYAAGRIVEAVNKIRSMNRAIIL